MAQEAKSSKFDSIRHPVYNLMQPLWHKWRLAYQGGQPFIDEFLEQYSKREKTDEFKIRKKLTFNPAHAKAAINIVRDAIAVKLPETVREGDDKYTEAMNTNADLLNTSMDSFMGSLVLPDLLSVAKVLVYVDAPNVEKVDEEGNPLPRTAKDDDEFQPYLYTYKAEDLLSWANDDGANPNRFTSALLREVVEVRDDDMGLPTGTEYQYRWLRMLPEENKVEVKVMDAQGERKELFYLELDRVPLVEIALPMSLMTDIADMQVALLNLNSTDMSFLWRVNFPVYTEQFDPAEAFTPPEEEMESGLTADGYRKAQAEHVINSGVGQGRRYGKDLERPAYIAPPTDSVKISLEKQESIILQIKQLLSRSLTSLSTKALEQSGDSKRADRVGQDAGLAYIAETMENGEREIAEIWHQYLGIENAEISIRYPKSFSMKTDEDRMAEAERLKGLRGAVRSPSFDRSIQELISIVLLEHRSEEGVMAAIKKEVEEAPYFENDKTAAEVILMDMTNGLVSKELASRIRGYPQGATAAAEADKKRELDLISGQNDGNNPPPEPPTGEGEEGEQDGD